ncbi:MAG: sigma-54 dependent transcriptional regulator [Candidatus Brocadiia bacterium]|jgi:DNA-binding NtrC family response regulator|nr:sigma-54 dependent transcriptional regulator [Candidatus Brocadiia bacterium]
MQNVFSIVRNVAATDAPVFITGESGTGKELVASALHKFSRRREGEFVCVNCAAIPKDLLESELFGHEKGSFTGAESQRIGCCERADGGTLFLDEVGSMDVRLQSKMLRFLQDYTFTRVGGGGQALQTDTRVIAATNTSPAEQIGDGRLREDLYYRLNVVPVELPPLRDRPEDIPVLAQHFLMVLGEKYSKYFVDFSADAMRLMLCYGWPGNVRQLQNVIERIVVLATADRITPELFPEEIREAAAMAPPPELQVEEALRIVEQALKAPAPEAQALEEADDVLPFDEVEKRAILDALRKCDGDISKAARKLGLSRATIYRKLEKYGER